MPAQTMKRGALDVGVDRSDGGEARQGRRGVDGGGDAAIAVLMIEFGGDEQENLDPAAPIRDGSERIGDGGDAIAPRIAAGVEADDDAVPDSQATLGASSEDHRLGAMAATAFAEVGTPTTSSPGSCPSGGARAGGRRPPTRERVFSETGRAQRGLARQRVEDVDEEKALRCLLTRPRGSGARTW